MSKLILSILCLLIGLGAPPTVFAADEPKDNAKPKAEKPQLGDRDDVAIQNKRFLKVRNETSGTLNVFLQYKTLENNVWTWVPGDPAQSTEALSFEVEAGQEVDVKNKEQVVGASRMRIWATGPTQKWLKYKTKDTWLVPERNEDGEHIYFAPGLETYTFVFSSSKDKGAIAGDSDLSGEQSLPTEGDDIPPIPPDIIWDDVPDPLPPDFPIIRDLAVLPVYVTGLNAKVRVKNLGHFSPNLGRRLMVQRLAPGSLPEDRGPIGVLFHYAVKNFYLVGMAPGNYLAFVSPGDDGSFQFNDKKAFTIAAALYSDAAVLPVSFAGGKVHLKVKNVGTAPVAGVQKLLVGKVPMGIAVDHGPIGALAVNDIKAFPAFLLAAGNYKAYVTPGDGAPHQFNDVKYFAVAAASFADHDLLPVTVAAGKAKVKVKNTGTADAPAGPHLKIMKMPAGIPVDHGPVGALNVGMVKAFPAIPLGPGNYKAFLSPADAPPHHANDQEFFVMPAAPDLAAGLPAKVGAKVKGTVKNNGPGLYPGGARTWHIEKMTMGMWVAVAIVGSHVIPALGPGDMHPIQGTYMGAGTYRIRITPGDGTPANDVKSKALP